MKFSAASIFTVILLFFDSCNYYSENTKIEYKQGDNKIQYKVVGTEYKSGKFLITVGLKIFNLSDNSILFDLQPFELKDELDSIYKPFNMNLERDSRTNKLFENLVLADEKFEIQGKDSNSVSIGYFAKIMLKDFEHKNFYWGFKNGKKVKLDVKL